MFPMLYILESKDPTGSTRIRWLLHLVGGGRDEDLGVELLFSGCSMLNVGNFFDRLSAPIVLAGASRPADCSNPHSAAVFCGNLNDIYAIVSIG